MLAVFVHIKWAEDEEITLGVHFSFIPSQPVPTLVILLESIEGHHEQLSDVSK